MNRRDLLKISLASTGLLATAAQAQPSCATDGTPAQFIPKKAADPRPAENDLEKFPKCPYCGMDRRQFHHSRMLLQYSDDLPDGVCSLHCAAISLAVNVDREPKSIWVADNASAAEIKPLLEVDQATFLIGSRIKGVMSRRSKVAYGSEAAARAAMAENGGDLGNFEQALLAAYTDMSQDVAMIRRSREERRQRAARPQG
ncbi:MAG: nitrous oxide reductase accessory protein NosL [Candidatus Accumulibacter sp.]|uniref:nitrous oxide reductase accessory protein NosL n=1 Tax=Accumulibacter sp. TaxID=2053492 RepID=UPI001A57FA82|nr:nitrous oxide reductase accessory protein NosL [Accumulibacter sp.]MBL8392090.1 nitrous oxide reductase accessory protein NosL [Accumulibacter sp.]HRD89855.1 nitrous oxide reductase accessory protein NosL [Accumulibacter sp.]